jgi:hypothetical protein
MATTAQLSNLALSDAEFTTTLVSRGEWDRALTHARLLVSSIEMVMASKGITATPITIHDSTGFPMG